MGYEPTDLALHGEALRRAERLSRRTGRPIEAILDEALAAYERSMDARPLGEDFTQLVARVHAQLDQVDRGRGSDTSDLYDEEGVPL